MRWRTAKKALHPKESKETLLPYTIAPFLQRLKAFVVDSFMLLMPILYIVFYIIYGSREGFAEHILQGWLLILIPYGMITLAFLKRSGQTPGYKAYDLKLIDLKMGQMASLGQLIVRYSVLLLTAITIIGLFIPLLRKDKLALYDILSQTAPICK
ncbi:RDD family protein [Sulfurospirillum oryzae]|uniref:RDD family protein n=1 Tax=Sulfurospirillum oryzae TaxID=2976535 RepID=UPI0021E79F8E|nr:RDD family protein [Sulfurospirillum oryzae]